MPTLLRICPPGPIDIRNHGDIENNNSVRSWYVGYLVIKIVPGLPIEELLQLDYLQELQWKNFCGPRIHFRQMYYLPNGRDISRRYVEYVQAKR